MSRQAAGLAFAFDVANFRDSTAISCPAVRFHARMTQRDEVESGAKVKIRIAVLISVGFLAAASGQESRQASEAVARPIGLEIGQEAPAFVLMDQFGHEQSNKTLKGPKGTVLLFFRSADW
jgi:hypothetical protein